MIHYCDAMIRDQINKGHIELVNEDSPATKGVHYINRHGVYSSWNLLSIYFNKTLHRLRWFL